MNGALSSRHPPISCMRKSLLAARREPLSEKPFPGGPYDMSVLTSFEDHIAARIWHREVINLIHCLHFTCTMDMTYLLCVGTEAPYSGCAWEEIEEVHSYTTASANTASS
jgi:hypothetical protein